MPLPGTDADFARYEGVFWRVIASLARHGYAVPPSDARDLIHDFYLDAWNGLQDRFNPELGSFVAYIGGAFYRFARRRILKFETLAHRAVDFESAVAGLFAAGTPPDILERNEDLAFIHAALEKLLPNERQVFEDFLSEGKVSERDLAQRYALSRYALRELLINSMGKLLVSLQTPQPRSDAERTVADLLWRQGETPRSVANLLQMPIAEVQARRNQFVYSLLASVRQTDRLQVSEKTTMKTQEPLTLLRAALNSVGDSDKLKSVRQFSADIQAALDEEDLELDDRAWSILQDNPYWLAAVYESLAGDDKVSDSTSDLSRAIDKLRQNEQHEIGEAFSALMSELPQRFRPSSSDSPFFAKAKIVDDVYQLELRTRSSVHAAGEAALGFVPYGLTPESIYDATRGLSLLFNRIRQASSERSVPFAEAKGPVVLQAKNGNAWFPVNPSLLVAEVAATPDLPSGTETPLTHWLVETLKLRPLLIEGYRALINDQRICFQVTRNDITAKWRDDIIARWTYSETLAAPGAPRL